MYLSIRKSNSAAFLRRSGTLCGLWLVGLYVTGCTFSPGSKDRDITIEVAVFEGGYGINWHKRIARQYERLHPGIHIDLWGDPRVDEKIKPRILREDPPDLVNCGLPVWKLIVAGKLLPLDDALDTPAYGQRLKWRDTLTPGVLSEFKYRGKTYAMPSNLTAWVCWYDRRMFRKYGWQPPKTWGQFLSLCEKVKAAGFAPLAFQGKYVGGYAWPTLLSIYQRLVPLKRWYGIEDLNPGAFEDPEFIHAARLLQDLFVKDVPRGALAMTHTESQLEWCNGRAAMVFCGLWLENEMKNALPPDFEMACFPVPAIEGGKGDSRAIYGGGAENFFVFKQGKHANESLDFLKFMLSRSAGQSYVRDLDTLSPVRNAADGVNVSSGLQSALDVLKGSTHLYMDRLEGLYPSFSQNVVTESLGGLVSGKITPEAFATMLESAADKMRRDPDLYKPPPIQTEDL